MASYPPPTPIEPLPIFNPVDFPANSDAVVSDANKLDYPVAQGLETFVGIINNSDTTLAGGVYLTSTTLNPTSLAVQPASTDTSTKIPTTAWVQSAITTSSATYATLTYVNTTFQTIANMVNYLTTATASATYQTIAGMSSYALLASPTFTGVPLSTTATLGTNNTQIATTAFVSSAISAIPSSSGTTITNIYTPSNNTTLTITPPTGAKKCDIQVIGTGGLAGAVSYAPDTEYLYIGSSGGGAGVASLTGIYFASGCPSMTIQNIQGTGGYTTLTINSTQIAVVYNGGNGSGSGGAVGGLGCSTPPLTSSIYGTWKYSNGTNGSPAFQSYTNPPSGVVSGQNPNGGIINSSTMGSGQQYASYSGGYIPAFSASPIRLGGCIITWYISS
jgi:hypothetical protein